MNFYFLLLLLVSLSSCDILQEIFSLPTSDEASCYEEYYRLVTCVRPHQNLIESVLPTLKEEDIYNIGLVNKALQIGRNISECLGHDLECEIPRISAYTLDYADYIGRKVYGDAFHCFINTNILETFQSCESGLGTGRYARERLEDISIHKNETSTMLECAAKKMYEIPSCSIERIVNLYQGANALSDLFYQFERWQAKYSVEWNFDAEKYCDN